MDTAQLARYFDIRQLWESHKTESLTRADRDLLRAGDKRFQGALFESLYQKWSAGTVSQSDLEVHFGDSRGRKKRGFSTHLLPDNYDIFRGANSAPLDRHLKTTGLIPGLLPGL